MNIGVIGSGNMGASMGKIWAAKGHKVLFSFSKDREKPRAVAATAGSNAHAGTPTEAVAFGKLVLLSVPWAAVPEALKAAGNFDRKILFSCVNCLKPDFSGLEVGTSTSAAEEILKLVPGAKMVEAIPPMAQILAADSATTLRLRRALRDLDLDPVDAGPLTSARYIEPAGMLCVQLAYDMGMGTKLAMKLLRE